MRCFEAGALATGATIDVVPLGPPYSEFTADDELARLYQANATEIGRTFPGKDPMGGAVGGSTDRANISLLLPTIHPMLGLDSLPAVNHQPEFTAHCITEIADKAVLDGAAAMAMTVIDAATTAAVRTRLLDADTTYSGRSSYPWRF
jgi:metal-dependent amidase/aminoacylase/carboxypeptidase family protein